MAPEVLANQRYSNKADVYSFAVVMWECCARQVPFEGLNGVQAGARRVLCARPRSASTCGGSQLHGSAAACLLPCCCLRPALSPMLLRLLRVTVQPWRS
jgi:serine/threonine protein kinase